MAAISTELFFTSLTAGFTAVIWMPIIVNRLAEMGPWKALSNPEPDVRPHANWAYRMGHAHRNAIENLVVFVPLAIAVHVLGLSSPVTGSVTRLRQVNIKFLLVKQRLHGLVIILIKLFFLLVGIAPLGGQGLILICH